LAGIPDIRVSEPLAIVVNYIYNSSLVGGIGGVRCIAKYPAAFKIFSNRFQNFDWLRAKRTKRKVFIIKGKKTNLQSMLLIYVSVEEQIIVYIRRLGK